MVGDDGKEVAIYLTDRSVISIAKASSVRGDFREHRLKVCRRDFA
jgi:hypothetical protein